MFPRVAKSRDCLVKAYKTCPLTASPEMKMLPLENTPEKYSTNGTVSASSTRDKEFSHIIFEV